MNQKLLTITGLIAMGVVLGATINSVIEPNTKPIDRKVAKAKPAARIINPFTENANSSGEEKLLMLEQSVQILQNQLQHEIEQRKQLQHKLALLEDNLTASVNANSDEEDIDNFQSSGETTSPHQSGVTSRNNNWFNEQALMDAGVDQSKVSYIKDVYEQAEMDKLYLRDQATREGWIGSDRYNTAAKEIADRANALKTQLNENEYDAYLYAAGRSNRVIVESVLSNSPASNAGIQAGDVILSYDNQRVYSWTDLTGATSKGTANTTVPVTIVRNNQKQQVYVPRGPLGVRLTTDSVAP